MTYGKKLNNLHKIVCIKQTDYFFNLVIYSYEGYIKYMDTPIRQYVIFFYYNV